MHVSASDEIFSELEMLVGRHATDESCGGDVIFFELGEVLSSKDTSISKMEDETCSFPTFVAMYDKWCNAVREARVIWVVITKRMGLYKEEQLREWCGRAKEKDADVFDTKEMIWASATICDGERLVYSFSHIVFSIEWVLFCPSSLFPLLAAC